jgi:plasmid stabilization system protein ParE
VKASRITLSDAAIADILEQADWYQEKPGRKLAARWEKAVTSTLLRIVASPRSGARCSFSAEELNDDRVMLMVARDGVELPTPAFSGLYSISPRIAVGFSCHESSGTGVACAARIVAYLGAATRVGA